MLLGTIFSVPRAARRDFLRSSSLVPGWLLTEGGAWCSGGALFVLDEVLGIFLFL